MLDMDRLIVHIRSYASNVFNTFLSMLTHSILDQPNRSLCYFTLSNVSQFYQPSREYPASTAKFFAHAENRLCGICVLFPLRMRCQLPSYNIVGSHFNHRLTVVNRIKRVAHIKNWFKPVVSSKLLDEAKHEYRRVYFPRGRGKLSLLAGYQGRASGWDIVNHPLHQFILNRYSSSCNLRQRRAFVLPKTN